MTQGINTQVVKANQNASEVSYNNTISWLTATNVNSAIDEVHSKAIQKIASSTDNAIVRWDGTTWRFVQDSSVFITDTWSVGIGTSSPTWKLHIVDGWTSLDTTIKLNNRFTFRWDGVMLWWSAAAHWYLSWNTWVAIMGGLTLNDLALYANGSEKVRVLQNGNVWIGTASPSARLEVSGSITLTAWTATNDIILPTRGQRMRIWTYWTLSETVSGAAYIQWNNIAADRTLASTLVKTASASDGCQYIAMRYDRGVWIGTGIWVWDAVGTTYSDTVNTRLMITTAGNVWINEFVPDYRLDVNGAIWFAPWSSVTPVDNGDVVFEATSNTQFTIKYRGTDSVIRSSILTLS